MTKADIIEHVQAHVEGLSKKQASDYVEATFDLIKTTLAKGEIVKLAGLGSFIVRNKKERVGRNPVTGEPVAISKRRVVTFKVSQVLRQRVNGE